MMKYPGSSAPQSPLSAARALRPVRDPWILASLLLLLAWPAASASVASPAPPSPAAPSAPSAPPPAAAQGTAPSAPPKQSPAAPSADLAFLEGNLLATDGMLSEAQAAFEQAEKENPDSAYIHLEHAQVLVREAQSARQPAAQAGFLHKAAAEVDKARHIAPQNLDVLRGVGLVYLDLASADPSALATALEALQAVNASDPDDVQTALNLGRLYLDQQQAAKAAAVFRDIIERSPQQRSAYALLVEALLRDEKAREAETVLAQILDFEPAALEARLTLAELQSRRNDYAAVLATLKAAPEPGHSDPRLQRQLAWGYYLTGDLDTSLATLEPLLESAQAAGTADADDLQMVLLKGLALAAQGHNQEAGELLQKLRGERPTDAALATILSKVLERGGHPEEAVRVLADLDSGLAKAGKHDEERQARLELAQVYFDAKDWDRVQETLQPLLHLAPKEDPAREPAMLLASDALVQRKSYDEALKLLDKGQTSPPSPALLAKRAEVLYKAGRGRDATRQLDDLASSKDAISELAAAETYQRLERYPESIPVLEKLVGKSAPAMTEPNAKAAHFLLGAAYERSGKRDQAVAEFRRLIGTDPEYHAALNYLGYMFAEQGEHLDEAKVMVEKAVALEPDNGAYVDSLGWVYFRLGRFEDARLTLERAAHLEIADGTVQEHLGDVYGAMGQPDRAGEAYRRALALESDDAAKTQQIRHKLDRIGGAGGARP
jgi:tetratricopeptide (TPR) repeat protein